MAISKRTEQRRGAAAVRSQKLRKKNQLLERIRRLRHSIQEQKGLLTESYPIIRAGRER